MRATSTVVCLLLTACAPQAPVATKEVNPPAVETAPVTALESEAPNSAATPIPVAADPVAIEPAASTRSMLPQRRPGSEPGAVEPIASPQPARAPTPEVLVVVLPEADGKVGTVLVENENGSSVLNSAYASARVAIDGEITNSILDGTRVREQFSAALRAMPERPASYLVWFAEGQDEPTAESSKELKKILQLIRQRPAPDISVIGHADAIGTESRNDKLSLQRARKIRSALVKLGIPADHINAAGRGAREPLYLPEQPDAPEPRNRRVEISVR